MKGDKGFISGVHHHQTGLAKKLNKFKQNKKDAKKHMNTHMVAQRLNHLPAMQGRPGFDPWIGKTPWRRERLPTPVFWPGEFHGLYSSWGCKELDTTE